MKVMELIAALQSKNPNATVLLITEGKELYVDVDPELRELPIDGSVVIYPKS